MGKQHLFGEMGVQTVDDKQYIAFSVEGEYESDIANGMAWGIKTKSDGKFFPILYVKDFNIGAKDSDTGRGRLVLTACDIILNGLGTGIQTGGVRIEGDPSGQGLYFYDANNASKSYMEIFPENVLGESSLSILDKMKFFKNQAGSSSFKIGDSPYILMSDEGEMIIEDGSFNCWRGSVTFGTEDKPTHFSLHASSAFMWGNLQVYGNVYADNISSDKRIKKNIQDSKINALDIIKQIKHRQFDKETDGKHYDIGYVAQEMEKIDENFVFKSPKTEQAEERYYINELPIIATLSKAIQEQQEMIEQLQIKIKEMEDKLNEIN